MRKKSKTRRILCALFAALILIVSMAVPVYATNDPIGVVNNLSNFIFGLIFSLLFFS